MHPEQFTPNQVEHDPKLKMEKLEKELLVREIPLKYSELITDVHLVIAKSPYSELLRQEIDKDPSRYEQFLASKFKDGTVLDLACGQSYEMNQLAKRYNAKRYIGVDLNPVGGAAEGSAPAEYEMSDPNDTFEDLVDSKFCIDQKQPQEENLPPKDNEPKIVKLSDKEGLESLRIKSDMLNLIARLKDNSINTVIISGVEGRSDYTVNEKYLSALEQEIQRVLTDTGICISYYGDVHQFSNLNESLEIRGKIYSTLNGQIYKKTAKPTEN